MNTTGTFGISSIGFMKNTSIDSCIDASVFICFISIKTNTTVQKVTLGHRLPNFFKKQLHEISTGMSEEHYECRKISQDVRYILWDGLLMTVTWPFYRSN